MKSNTKQVRDAVKNLIIEKGANNILNRRSDGWKSDVYCQPRQQSY